MFPALQHHCISLLWMTSSQIGRRRGALWLGLVLDPETSWCKRVHRHPCCQWEEGQNLPPSLSKCWPLQTKAEQIPGPRPHSLWPHFLINLSHRQASREPVNAPTDGPLHPIPIDPQQMPSNHSESPQAIYPCFSPSLRRYWTEKLIGKLCYKAGHFNATGRTQKIWFSHPAKM